MGILPVIDYRTAGVVVLTLTIPMPCDAVPTVYISSIFTLDISKIHAAGLKIYRVLYIYVVSEVTNPSFCNS